MNFDPEIYDPNGTYRQWIKDNPTAVQKLAMFTLREHPKIMNKVGQ